MSVESDVRVWVEKSCALVDGVALDYIAVHYRAGAKSWPEQASVRVEQRPVSDVVAEVLGHVADVLESGAAEDRGPVAIRLKLVRAKAPAGSRTFRPPGGPLGSDPEASDEETPKEALVATVRELRLLTAAVTSELASQSAHGWKLATELATQNARLTTQLAEARAEARYAVAPQTDDVTRMAMDFLPRLPDMLASLAQLAALRSQQAPPSE